LTALQLSKPEVNLKVPI